MLVPQAPGARAAAGGTHSLGHEPCWGRRATSALWRTTAYWGAMAGRTE